jgi:hypothetical protein
MLPAEAASHGAVCVALLEVERGLFRADCRLADTSAAPGELATPLYQVGNTVEEARHALEATLCAMGYAPVIWDRPDHPMPAGLTMLDAWGAIGRSL